MSGKKIKKVIKISYKKFFHYVLGWVVAGGFYLMVVFLTRIVAAFINPGDYLVLGDVFAGTIIYLWLIWKRFLK